MEIISIILAQAVSEPPWVSLAQYGVLGLVVIGFIFGQIAPGYQLKKAEKDRDIAIAELSAVRQKIEDSIVPALTRATDAVTAFAERANGGRK